MKHTPGPWEYRKLNGDTAQLIRRGSPQEFVQILPAADAVLMAAAPDLAAAIQAHLAMIDSREEITAEKVNANTAAFRAALSKAGIT